jgi:hypothetical protein
MIHRRTLLGAAPFLAGAAMLPGWAVRAAPAAPLLPPFFDDLGRRTFNFFWERANAGNGLVPDRWPTPSFCSIAAVGFALTAYGIGAARGYVSRSDAASRTLTTLRFFDRLPQGPAATGVAGHKGFFYHFLDMQTGLRYGQCELSSVDTALLHLGMLFSAGFFDGADPAEQEIRRLALDLVDRAEWPWFQNQAGDISMGWGPEKGFIDHYWTGYNEGMMVVLLALGSGRHPVADGAWDRWTGTYARSWRGQGMGRHLAFAPLFGHQYTHMWVDFRGIRDAVMRDAGFDYFENSRRAAYAARAYSTENPGGWRGYSQDIWGLTACDGPGHAQFSVDGKERRFHGYSARGPVDQPDGLDDGTLSPTAALGCLPFAPEIVVPAALAMKERFGERLYGQYGFLDSFNPSFIGPTAKSRSGSVDPVKGWVAKDYIAIDQGPILGMMANQQDGLVWQVMRGAPILRRGLRRAGFTGGWLQAGDRP